MMAIILLASFLAFLYSFPSLLYLNALMVGAYQQRRRAPVAKARLHLPSILILVPAHNEEIGIRDTVLSLKELDYPSEKSEIWVIADNCQDQTAKLARQEGVKVLERFHAEEKSKGYALAFAIEQVKNLPEPPDALVIIDADSTVQPNLLKVFAERWQRGEDWQQAYYTVANPDDSWRTELMTMAFAHFNGLFLLGQEGLGLGCSFRGNGMFFSWQGLKRAPFQAYGLTEDLEYSYRLRFQGEKVSFAFETTVWGEMIDGHAKAQKSQRQRWEHGRTQLKQWVKAEIPKLRLSPLRRIWYYLDANMLAMAPLCFWLALSFVLSFTVSHLREGSLASLADTLLWLHAWGLLSLLLYLGAAFRLGRIPLDYLSSLFFVPSYMIWKFFLALKKAPQAWVRTERKGK